MAKLIMANTENKMFADLTNVVEYTSSLDNNCVTQQNMQFANVAESLQGAGLRITGNSSTGIWARINNTDEDDKNIIASGTCDLGTDGRTTNISLNLYRPYTGDVKLHFSNEDINRIMGNPDDDVIYIERNTDYNSNGVSKTATLNFYHGGTDTIYFNGATTVKDIWGGVLRRGYTYSSA